MKEKQFSVIDFLDRNHISIKKRNFNENVEVYIKEMQAGLNGESTIPMFPTYIEDLEEIPAGVPVLVLDAGGTNFRAAIVRFSEDNKAEISRFRKRSMPGIGKELSREEFFGVIADFIEDLVSYADRIGFCFSYPMIKTADKDGRLTKFSKEIMASGVEGQLIGRGVIEALQQRGINHVKKIVLLNDTIATLLAGKSAGGTDDFDSYIGVIVGTGVNASYNELNSNIGKLSALSEEGSQLINMEAGSCGIFPAGEADIRFRASTANADAYKFEKMVSGGYLGQLWISVLRSASDDCAFSREFAASLESFTGSGAAAVDAAALSEFLETKTLPAQIAPAADASDIETAHQIGAAIVSRSSYMVSVMIAGILSKTGRGRERSRPVCVCVDGTTFWKLKGLREQVEENLERFSEQNGIYCRITRTENAPVIGAAVAGLTND